MRPHPRIRKTIKWGGAAVTLLLVVVWIGSGWWTVLWAPSNSISAGAGQGCVSFAVGKMMSLTPTGPVSPPDFQCWHHPSMSFAWRWTPEWFEFGEMREITVPIWALIVIACATSAYAWRVDAVARRQARLNLCPKCNYDRAGIAAGAACPECGPTG
jgi:hypothetical protein